MLHKQLKYGRIERERRFLLDQIPPGEPTRRVDIHDRYILNSRLRLRKMTSEDGSIAFKLARKLPPHAPGALVMGNLYLDEGEYTLLNSLPAHDVLKRRLLFDGWGVDVFDGALDGLILAERESDDPEALARMTPPFAFIREVTGEIPYRGGTLAAYGLPT